MADCDYIKYAAGLTPLAYECLERCDRDSEHYVEYNTEEAVGGVMKPKTNCTTPEYCVNELNGKVFDNTTCHAGTTKCEVYQAKSPSTMLWFCNRGCDYEVVASGGGQIKVCSDCVDMWRIPHQDA